MSNSNPTNSANNSLWQFIWQSIKPYKLYFILMLQAPIIGAFFIPLTQYATKLIIDFLANHQDFTISDLALPIAIFIGAQIILEIAWRISNYADYKSTAFIRADIVKRSYEHILKHSYGFFTSNLSGSISSKINDLSDGVRQLYDNLRFDVLIGIANILVALGFLFFVSSKIFIAVLLGCFLLFPAVFYLSKKINHLSADYFKNRQQNRGFIVDSIANIISVFSFTGKKREQNFVEESLKKVVKSERKMQKYDFILHLVVGIIYVFTSVAVLFLLINLYQEKRITIGDFALTIGLLFHILEVAFHLMHRIKDVFRQIGQLQESYFFIGQKPQFIDAKNAKDLQMKKAEITFKNISFSYETKAILQNFNLKIKAGEKIGLVGHSGQGKSTLINLLLRYFQLDQGQILIDGQDIAKVKIDSLRKNIAVIPQDTQLFHRSLYENISYGNPKATEQKINEIIKKTHLDDFIKDLKDGLNTLVGERGIKLSGGQRQRIAIARAMLKDAPILILDEATSSLDSKTESFIQKSLNFFINDNNKTVIAIAHRLSTLKNMDRILVLSAGKIVEEGDHNSLIAKNGYYQRLWELQRI